MTDCAAEKLPTDLNCDLVMKGGITSGVVYLKTVTEIARAFNLKSVGGTSAGAIAASAAAAAEFARVRGGGNAGFDAVDKLPEFLSRTNVSDHSNLFTFFQPQDDTRRLYGVLTAVLNAPSAVTAVLRVLGRAVLQYGVAAALGVVPGALLMLHAWNSPPGTLRGVALFIGLLVASVGMIVAIVIAIVREFGIAVPQNSFGLCSGMSGEVFRTPAKSCCEDCPPSLPESDKPPLALTPWLTQYLNATAGLADQADPLTFGQLWSPTTPPGQQPQNEVPVVRLEMMTTCLTWGRPFRLPFRQSEEGSENVFFFRECDFFQLFPESVVKWMVQHDRENDLPEDKRKLFQCWRKKGFHALPDPWNLPVVVATRMSLSFPVLLSAIPLYAYDPDATEEYRRTHAPAPCWFSDGGICCNFPMHFFDSPLPRWPTFALNFAKAAPDAPKESLVRGWMPDSNNQGIKETWNPLPASRGLGQVLGFFGSIIGTMQNWSDNTLARMPGYRDRISHVPLTPTEGGLNLDMPGCVIQELGRRGAATGTQFVERFKPDSRVFMNWDNHRWIRLRSLLANMEGLINALERTLAHEDAKDPANDTTSYEHWMKTRAVGTGTGECYPFVNQPQRKLALDALAQMRALAKVLKQPHTPLEHKAPRPRPELRPRPRI